MKGQNFINNEWIEGRGEAYTSVNPANDQIIWSGHSADETQIEQAIVAAKQAHSEWSSLSFDERLDYLNQFQKILMELRSSLAETLSREIGKPLWEAETEIGAMIHKLPITVEAYHDRCKQMEHDTPGGLSRVRHKSHGVIAVFGPFNFPAHLPNGHIMPALLAGNTIVYKPSELAPLIAETVIECWEKINPPKGVLNLVQGSRETGKILSQSPKIDGLFFTGSYRTGCQISELFGKHPEKILALELGGNNPLIVNELGENIHAAVYHTIQSAYITAGQRCTCARRLIVVNNKNNQKFLNELKKSIENIIVGPYTDLPEPFMGPVVSNTASHHIFSKYQELIAKGAKIIVPMERLLGTQTFLSPALIDVTNLSDVEDQEIFGPLLQVFMVENFEKALKLANNTEYGLAAGLLSENEEHYLQFLDSIRVGIVSWNRPTTGASSRAPFGGVGKSGNFRPSAYYAADYCSFPVACLEKSEIELPEKMSPGIILS